MSFVGGKLRLKGDNDGGVSKKKKKKKKRRREKHQLLSHVAEDHEEEQEENTAGYVIKRKDGPVDRRTKVSKVVETLALSLSLFALSVLHSTPLSPLIIFLSFVCLLIRLVASRSHW